MGVRTSDCFRSDQALSLWLLAEVKRSQDALLNDLTLMLPN